MIFVRERFPGETDPNAVAVDQKGERKPEHATVTRREARVSHGDAVVELEMIGSPASESGIVVHGKANYLQALRSEFALPRGEDRHLHFARRAPGGPEVEENDCTAVAAQVEWVTAEIGKREIWRRLTEEALRAKDRMCKRK